ARLLPYLRPYRFRAFLAVLGVLGFAVTSTLQPLLIGLAVDRGIKGDVAGVARIGMQLAALVFVAWGFQYLQLTQTGYIGHRVLYRLRTQMFDHIHSLSLSFIDRHEVGRIMSRVTSDVTSMQELLTSGALTIFSDILILGVVVFVLLQRDLQLASVTFVAVPILVMVMVVWQKRARSAFVEVRQAISTVNATLNENVSGVRVIQSLSREDENARRFDQINRQNLKANINASRLSAAVLPMVEGVVAMSTALVLVVGGIRVAEGAVTAGIVVSFVLYIQRFFDPVRDLVLQYTQIQRAMAGGLRIVEVLDTKPDVIDRPNAQTIDLQGRVDFDHVTFQYVEGRPVLRDINLHVEPGETIAFVGQTGAGKSTMINLIGRYYDVTDGAIRIDGLDVRDIKLSNLHQQMGVVLQEPFLFSGTVRDNIRYGRLDATDEEVEEAARLVGAADFIRRLENGYDTVLAERAHNLSVGQRQLISFARAILSRPRILVLDEATANVDTQTEVIIQRALQELLRGRTSFVIAHRLSTIRDASRIVVLERGQIAEMGTHQQLLDRDGIYARLYKMAYATTGEDGVLSDNLTADGPAPVALAGQWNVTMTTARGTREATLAIDSSNGAVHGTWNSPMGGASPLIDGKLDGDRLRWSVQTSGPMGEMTMRFEAVVQGDALAGEVALGSMGNGTFTGRRA
ncbi:MAG: ABC transporter ATP-binding protein, partial [Dehalococcoidia bacterium]